MLARENFGGGEHRALRAGLDRDQQAHRRDQRLARSDVALQQAQHRRGLSEVPLDLGDAARLRAGGAIGQAQLVAQTIVADQRPAPPLARVGAHQRHRELVGEDLVIGQAFARHLVGRVSVDAGERVAPVGPPTLRLQAGVDPFG
ncbi:hypothetical protein WR25_01628 [Diploscapter pachys]|uniref:Uncharacterized protein n=1 Tax=Diploscapter pachys TaxID=2018661 RepID=A0A2A2K579_9BILA|nr:hypothetical protein WR25_01628 [Diploscapter pachys]